MSFDVQYEIINVNVEARCMEIVYTANGRPTQHIGARLPYEGETLEAVVRMYSPVAYWKELEMSVVPPQVGTIGQFTVLDPVVEELQPQPTVQGAQQL